MNVDPFIRNTVIVMVVITSFFIVLTFIGTSSCAGIIGISETIETTASNASGVIGETVIPTVSIFGALGEIIGYTCAGIVSGLIIGYYWSDLFRRHHSV